MHAILMESKIIVKKTKMHYGKRVYEEQFALLFYGCNILKKCWG